LQDFSPDIVSWMNFAVFINAWNLCSNVSVIPGTDQSSQNSWWIVDNLLKTCIDEQLTDTNQMLTSPGSNIPLLAWMVTEPITWHLLVIQSCMRSMTPQGKKKKKGGPSERPNTPHLQAIRSSVQCMTDTLQGVQKCLSDQVKPEDQALDILVSHLQGTSAEGPGQITRLLDESAAAASSEVGGRIAHSLEPWSCACVMRRLVQAENETIAELRKMCTSKLKLLASASASLNLVLH